MEMGKKAQRRAYELFGAKTMIDKIREIYYEVIGLS
jgi:hypothetical protein